MIKHFYFYLYSNIISNFDLDSNIIGKLLMIIN